MVPWPHSRIAWPESELKKRGEIALTNSSPREGSRYCVAFSIPALGNDVVFFYGSGLRTPGTRPMSANRFQSRIQPLVLPNLGTIEHRRTSIVHMQGTQTEMPQPRLFSDDGSSLGKWKDEGSGVRGAGGHMAPACANTYA